MLADVYGAVPDFYYGPMKAEGRQPAPPPGVPPQVEDRRSPRGLKQPREISRRREQFLSNEAHKQQRGQLKAVFGSTVRGTRRGPHGPAQMDGARGNASFMSDQRAPFRWESGEARRYRLVKQDAAKKMKIERQ